MSSQSSNLVNQFEFEELTSESNGESIHEPEWSMEEMKQIKEKNVSIPEKGDGRDDTTRLIQHDAFVTTVIYMRTGAQSFVLSVA